MCHMTQVPQMYVSRIETAVTQTFQPVCLFNNNNRKKLVIPINSTVLLLILSTVSLRG